MKIPSAENWRKIVSRGKYPLLFVWELNQGLMNFHKITGFKIKMLHYCRVAGNSYIYEPEAKRVVEEIKKVLTGRPITTLTWLKKYYLEVDKLFELINYIRKRLSAKTTEKELMNFYLRYTKQSAVVWRWGYLPFLIDEAIEYKVNGLLERLKVSPAMIPGIIKILSVNKKISKRQQEAILMLKLARQVEKKGIKGCQREISRHLEEWGWKNSWIYHQGDFKRKDLEDELSALKKRRPLNLLKKLNEERQGQNIQKERLLKKYNNKQLVILSRILSEYNFWHSYKMEQMTQAIFLIKPLLEDLARKLKLNYQQFIELSPPEVKKKKFSLREINLRVKDSGILMLNGRTRILFGSELRKVKRAMEKRPVRGGVISGFAAFPGKVKGRALIIPSGSLNIKDFIVKPGEILVTSMTTPNMTPLVKKAAAVVTDEGGILCHASIISRELGIPCVIGTKIATKVLKGGDLIEVDAEKGLVKKLIK